MTKCFGFMPYHVRLAGAPFRAFYRYFFYFWKPNLAAA